MARRTRHLILFVKAPRFGTVKTRLARDVGRLAAWMFYRRALAQVIRRLGRDRRWRTWIAVTPDREARGFRPHPRHVKMVPQGRGDLGERMARAFTRIPLGSAVLVGGDIPAIRPAHIMEALRKLDAFDAVLGPAADGGYWLVGFRKPPPADVFKGVRWSTPRALADTLANLKRFKVAPMLPTLEDVDDSAAFSRLGPSGVP